MYFVMYHRHFDKNVNTSKNVGTYNPGHNTLELNKVLVEVQCATSIIELDIQYQKLHKRVTLQIEKI